MNEKDERGKEHDRRSEEKNQSDTESRSLKRKFVSPFCQFYAFYYSNLTCQILWQAEFLRTENFSIVGLMVDATEGS